MTPLTNHGPAASGQTRAEQTGMWHARALHVPGGQIDPRRQ
ncbi:MAG TPA: hypothetical protein VH641_01610 [Streptosporangiaceae bacterium]|jgi:hypothetical protein